MDTTAIITPEIYTDIQGLKNLKRSAHENAKGAAKEVAKQFEGLFVKMMLKSMRDASFGDEIFGSQQMDNYQDMYDNQMAMHLANGKGIGLADVIARQLTGEQSPSPSPLVSVSQKNTTVFTVNRNNGPVSSPKNANNEIQRTIREYINTTRSTVAEAKATSVKSAQVKEAVPLKGDMPDDFDSPAEFIEKLWPLAKQASEASGISAKLLIAQAALETGWGKAISKHANGKSSFNLFNIKADHRWDGARVTKTTVEYNNGLADKQKASFRSYESLEASFQDFINYISNEPRYQNAMAEVGNNNEFITELHNSGYATDPLYAEKVIRVMNGVELKNTFLKKF